MYRARLREQIGKDLERHTIEASEEREIDHLRTECATLQYETERAEETATRRLAIDSTRKERQQVLERAELRKRIRDVQKQSDKAHVIQSESKYKQYMAAYAQDQTILRSQLAHKLEEQIEVRQATEERKRRTAGSSIKKQPPKTAAAPAAGKGGMKTPTTAHHERVASQPSIQANFLKGMACPHGKMYVCAFCARDQAKADKKRK